MGGRWQRYPGADIVADVQGRIRVYADDWRDGWRAGSRILAPSMYVFLASLLPALAFGLQLDHDTRGTLGVVHVLAATAMTGLLQALIGGQPLLIVGVAEPIVIIYARMYEFASSQPGLQRGQLFLPWAAWVSCWTGLLLVLLAAGGACRCVSAFTRFSGELFGALIGVLFLQQAVKGIISNFRPDPNSSYGNHPAATAAASSPESTTTTTAASGTSAPESPDIISLWRLINGLWGLLLALGLLRSSLLVVRARSWRFLRKPLRGFLADYGPACMVLVWTGVSYAISSPYLYDSGSAGSNSGGDGSSNSGGGGGAVAVQERVPRRVVTPDVWNTGGGNSSSGGSSGGSSSWSVASRMGEVPGGYVAAALLPALVIAVLFYFDHSISSRMAQQPEYNLTRPPAYAWDLLLLAALTPLCGLLGLPPVNGVLPQAPMHTR
ncbi:hypothetical protein Agub_g13575, partial [Astrephomene gubernaculifera]